MEYLINLNVRSNYSFLTSTISLENYIEFAKKNGLKQLALTDNQVMYGTYQFYQMCQQANIKPLIGLECQWQFDDKVINLILFANNYHGYQLLVKITSYLNQKATNLSNSDIDQYLKNNRDLIIIIKVDNHGFKLLKRCFDFFSQSHSDLIYFGVNQANVAFYQELCTITTKIVPVNPVYYLKSEDIKVYQTIQAIKHQTTLTKVDLLEHGSDYYLSKSELSNFFPEAVLEQINDISNYCDWEFPILDNAAKIANLPQFPLPKGCQNSIDLLTKLCESAFNQRVPIDADKKPYRERLNYELAIINKMGFTDYFLIVADYVKFARQNKILYGPGRGSAASSLVAFILQITDVDPIHYDLIFERFLNPERASLPDIDIDFQDERREEVIQYLTKKYGASHVAHIVTFQTMALKMTIRDLGRVFNLALAEINEISRIIPLQYNFNLPLALKQSPKLVKFTNQYPWLMMIAQQIIGFPRQTSTHAAGIVLTKQPLTNYVPIQNGFNNVALTQYPMDDLASIGLIKMDILGLRNLTILANICQKIATTYQQQINLTSIPLDDQKTFQMLQNGDTTGIFQLESPGMRQILRAMKTNSLEDIIACSSLFRPGPQDYIPAYIRRKLEQEKVVYWHPDLKPFLAKTFGIIVYQEQILLILQKIANYSLAKADLIRRAISKKNFQEMNLQKNDFIQAALANHYNLATATKIWNDIEQFAGYGFNRAHAVAYSLIGYQLAYLKANYPLAFMACLLTSVIGNDEKLLQYLHECQKYRITILSPNINRSQSEFAIDLQNQAIIYSLLAIKQMSQISCHHLLQERKTNGSFTNFFQFCARAISVGLNRRNIEFLIAGGAFDTMEPNRTMLLFNLDNALKYAQVIQVKSVEGTISHLNFQLAEPSLLGCEFDQNSASINEYRALGLYLKYNPEQMWKSQLDPQQKTISFSQLDNYINNTVLVIGQLITIKTIRTKQQALMAFAVFQNDNMMVEATIFPKIYQKYQAWLQPNAVLLMRARIEIYQSKLKLIIESINSRYQATDPVSK